MDNFYNSVSLCEALLQQGTHVCGTLRLVRGDPKELQAAAKGTIAADAVIHQRKGDVMVLLWKDKKVVNIISTLHNADTRPIQRRVKQKMRDGTTRLAVKNVNKPVAICDYNDFMSGVDHFDQMIKYYNFTRKTHKWTKKIVFYFLQIAVYNAYCLYKAYSTDVKKMKLRKFHEELYTALIFFDEDAWPFSGDSLQHEPNLEGASPSSEDPDDPRIAMLDPPSGLEGNDEEDPNLPGPSHRPAAVRRAPAERVRARRRLDLSQESRESSDEDPVARPPPKKHPRITDPVDRLNPNVGHTMVEFSERKRRRCRVCTKKGVRKDAYYQCGHCKVPLCVKCALDYHRKVKYW